MPSAAVRFAIETAFLVLVALGAVLAELEPIVIVALVAVSTVLLAVVERSYRREAAAVASDEAAEPEPDEVETPKDAVREEPEPVAEPAPAVGRRSARAILATGPPPVVEPSPPEAEHVDEPEPQRVAERPSQEWNIWELERLVRDHPDDRRREEWSALVLSLREFAAADGMLPAEFDELVWETFGATLVSDAVTTETAAAP